VRGTPIRFEFRTGDNPFAGRKNTLTARQLAKKERNRQHIKSLKHKAKKRTKRDG
jgi:GTP-binding protein